MTIGEMILSFVLLLNAAISLMADIKLRRLGKEVGVVKLQTDGLTKALVKSSADTAYLTGKEEARSEGEVKAKALLKVEVVPLPVTDDRTAIAAERSATATERVADSTEKTAEVSVKNAPSAKKRQTRK